MMFVFLLLIQKSENCTLLNEVKALKFSLVTRTSYLSPSPSCPSHPFFCVMTSRPSLFWKVVSPLWPHLTPQQPEVVNTLNYPSLPRSCTVSSLSLSILLSSLLFPQCHCGRESQPTLIAPSSKAPPCSSASLTEPIPTPVLPFHPTLQSSHSWLPQGISFMFEWKGCCPEWASSPPLFFTA